jgi:ABC-type multidrug transport system ATPase subunit
VLASPSASQMQRLVQRPGRWVLVTTLPDDVSHVRRILRQSSTPRREPSGLRAQLLTRRFGERTILDAAELEVRPGVMAVLEGPNGAGKTTLLRIFATVVRPDRGNASVDGYDVVKDGAHVRQRIGAAFVNERSLYWRLTGRENLRLFARTRGLSGHDARLQVDSLLEELDLATISRRWVADLSAGQRQRLIIARSGLGAPSSMLIDEPLRGLDEDGIEAMLSFLHAQAARGAAVLVVAPKLDELQAHADALYRLSNGQIRPWTHPEAVGQPGTHSKFNAHL